MKKIETIWHHLLNQAIDHGEFQHTQAELAAQFHFSLSTINLALDKPSAVGAVRKSGKFFVVADPLKLLYLASTVRNLGSDIIYQTTSNLSIHQLESLTPPSAIYGGYSAATQILGESPSDYSALHLYLDPTHLGELQSRYPASKSGATTLIAFKKTPHLHQINHTTLAHTFIDVWNMPDWYTHNFTSALEDKIRDLLS